MISPPFSYAAFYVKGASKTNINIMKLYNATWAYLAIYLIGVVLFCLFPGIITYIPYLIFGK
jgi:TRAP-type mannitol/chloroaromatic compound transport system permease large subunit